jgi:hypothetical protein
MTQRRRLNSPWLRDLKALVDWSVFLVSPQPNLSGTGSCAEVAETQQTRRIAAGLLEWFAVVEAT